MSTIINTSCCYPISLEKVLNNTDIVNDGIVLPLGQRDIDEEEIHDLYCEYDHDFSGCAGNDFEDPQMYPYI